MIERRLFIPEKANEIFEIENSSIFCLIGDFDNGKIYHDISNGNHDMYYVEHDLMDEEERAIYDTLCNTEGVEML